MTHKKFREGMMIFERAKLLNSPDFSDKATEDVWFGILKHISNTDFMKAINIIIRTFKYFPVPAEIIKTAIPDNIIPADQEWENVITQINRCCGTPDIMPELSNPITCRVIASMGGLSTIWLDHRDRSYVRHEFMERYNKLVSSQMMRLMSGGEIKQIKEKNAST